MQSGSGPRAAEIEKESEGASHAFVFALTAQDLVVAPIQPGVPTGRCSRGARRRGRARVARLQQHIGASDGQRVVAAGARQVLVSSDGGKTFAATLTLASGGLHAVRFDPRPSSSAVYVHGLADSKLSRSTGGGQHWTNVTPPSSLQPPSGTDLRDVQVAADGTVVGLAHPGVITLPAP